LGGVELSCGKEFIWMAMNVTMWWNIKTKFSYQQSLDSKLVWQSTRGQNFKKLCQRFKKDSVALSSSTMTSAVFMQMMRHRAFGCKRASSLFGENTAAD
jgi:hypothetical protein